MVLIWSFGLPFLPGLASAARAGQPEAPDAHPSLNIVVYRGGRPDFYLLQTADPAQVAWDNNGWQLGGLSGQRQVQGRQMTLRLDLDCPVPASTDRLVGRVTLTGMLRQGHGDGNTDPTHGWSPLVVAATGRADLTCGDRQWTLAGRAYHDRNSGTQPLHTLGIQRWWWLRLALPDRELIAYHLIPDAADQPARSMCLTVDSDGQTTTTEDVDMVMSGNRRGIMGLTSPATITIRPPGIAPLTARLVHKVDDGPFYQRFQIEADHLGSTVRGFAEQVVPNQIDRAWSAPLVRMKVHRHDGKSSMWLPLFSGPRTGRLARLFGQSRRLPQQSQEGR